MARKRLREDRDLSSQEQGAELSYFDLSLYLQALWKEAGINWRIKKEKMHLYKGDTRQLGKRIGFTRRLLQDQFSDTLLCEKSRRRTL